VWALLLGYRAQVAMYSARGIRYGLASLNLRASRDLLAFGLGHSLAQIGAVISQQGDNLVVGRWLGPTALGVYGRAYNLMVMPAAAFERIVKRVLFPVMSQAQAQDQRQRLAGAYERARHRGLGVASVELVPLGRGAAVYRGAPRAGLGRGRAPVPAVHHQPVVPDAQ